MLSSEFSEVFSKHKNFKSLYDGCYSFDQVPKRLATNHFIIINYSYQYELGSHWATVFKESNSCLQCFDSLGITDEKKIKLTHLFANSNLKEVIYNKSQVQKNDTITCGHFVLYFLFNRLMNLDMKFSDLLNEIFTLNLDLNEKKVAKFYETVVLRNDSP